MANEQQVQDRYVALNGLRLHYREWGSEKAPLLLVLHGLNSHSWDWDFLCSAFSADYHVVAPDLRGHGESDWSDDYSWPRFGEDIAALVDFLAVDKFTLFAYSIPAGFAGIYAASHPLRVRRLVVVDNTPTRPMQQSAATAEAVRVFRASDSFANPSEVVDLWKRISPESNTDLIWHTVRHNTKQRDDGRWLLRDDPRAVPGVVANTLPPEEHWLALSRVACPTLIVHAEQSAIFNDEVMARMAATIPGSELVRLRDSGHRVQWDNPSGLVSLVKPFLNQLTSGTT